jgi:subtilisin family serine protease
MSDDELSRRIAEAGGRVFIGFKNPLELAGVDERGRALASPASIAAGKAHLRTVGVGLEFEFIDMPMVIARMPAARLAQLRRHPLIEYIEPIFPGTYTQQVTTWNVQRVNAPPAWAYSTGSGAKLLIADSGIETTHPDLAPAVVQSCETPITDGRDQFGHGTSVSGVAAAVNNAIHIVGVAHGVALWSSKIGAFAPDPGYAACAVQFGRVNGVHAINLSIGVTPHTALTDQINAAYNQNGIVVVAAAGNTNGGAVSYPASLSSVIAVSATDINDNFASFSAMGAKVELAAPGASVTSTCLGGITCAVSGTSFAAPHVAAAAALLKAYNASWSNTEIRQRLGAGATDLGPAGRDVQFGYGLLNITGAITAPPALYVSISGITTVKTPGGYTWTCNASGGVGGFTYQWTRSDAGGPYYFVGSGTTYSSWVDQYSGPYFDLRCAVTSGTQTVSADKRVNVIIPPS